MVRAKSVLLSGYSVAVIASLLTLLLRLLLMPILNENAPLLVFILPVLFSAWYGGLQSGLLATALCAAMGTYFFVAPQFSLGIPDLANLTRVAIFVIEGVCISGLSEAMRSAKNRAERVAARLKESEEQYRLLVEGVRDYAIFGLDSQGRVTSWNSGAELIKGYTAAETLGRHFSLFYLEPDVAQARPDQVLQIAAAEGRVQDEGWRRRKDGSLFWANVVITALQDEQSQLCGFSTVVRDITQQKRSEEALQESYGLLQTVIEGTADAIFVKDRQGRYKLVNSATARIFSRPKTEILGKADAELLPLEVATFLQQLDHTVMETGASQTFEEEIPEADGIHAFLTTKDPYRDAQGQIAGVIGVARDITERKQAEVIQRQLLKDLSDLKFALDQAAILVTTNAQGVIADVNDKFCEISKYSRAELIGQTHRLINSGYHSQEFFRHLWSTITQGKVWHGEIKNRAKDGTYYWVDTTIVPFLDELGKPFQFLAVRFDITDRKYAEADLQQLNITLEQRVAERTAQIEETNQELEAFTYSVSHDLRAPLRTMQGFAQALLEDCGEQLADFCRGYVDSIIDDAVQMNGLISDLLNYSRLTRTQITPAPTALNKVVNEALKQLTAEIREKQAQIRVAAPLPHVIAHQATLTQAVVNLIGNAIKFAEPDTHPQIDIFVTTERQDNHEWFRLWIVDNGIGIAPEHQERIFRVFERLHGAESYPGTGIGLAIVRKGLDRMGGQVGVESQLGQGSRFWIALPSAILPLDSLTHDPTSPNSCN